MTIERENAHQRSEACAYARAAEQRKRQDRATIGRSGALKCGNIKANAGQNG
jgi:hypothetical protein